MTTTTQPHTPVRPPLARSVGAQPQRDWNAYRPFPNVRGRNDRQVSLEVPLLVRALRLPARGSMLEVGCGRGIALPALYRLCRPRRLVGLDVNAGVLTEAAAHLAESNVPAELSHADVRRIPFPDYSFDVVIDFGTCYHISYPEMALQEVHRVLRPGGLFVHETRLGQLLSHPVRSFGRTLPWEAVPGLRRGRYRLFWATRVKWPPSPR